MNFAAIVLAAVVAQAAAPAAPVLDHPLRHLEYTYTVDYQRLGNGTTDAIGTGGSGMVALSGSGGRQGRLFADVMAVAKDGGLVVRVQEWQEAAPRPEQSYECAVYGDTRVICPPNLEVTDVENVLMADLGRGFFDPADVGAGGKWQRTYSNATVNVTSDFALDGSPASNPVKIVEHTEIKSVNGAFRNWHEDAKIVYDATLSVPASLHDVAVQAARGNAGMQTTVDLTLQKDSFAH